MRILINHRPRLVRIYDETTQFDRCYHQSCNSVYRMRINNQTNVSWGYVKEDSCSSYIHTYKLMRTSEGISLLSA